ncbi:MAG: ATP-binding domain-containing protein [Actinomycetota bacterium]|nr:ATP-binding domain-containing protein [Actinomycetota bacterium]
MTAGSQTELEAEQAVVDHAYRRLEDMRAAARALAADVLDQGAGGTFANRIERDVRMEVTGRRLQDLQVGEAGLVFGRIDLRPGGHLHIGRLAVADEDNEPLVVDWRAPAAEPFYRATARHDMGLARRRHLIMRGRRVIGLDDELLGDRPEATDGDGEDPAPGMVLVGEGALLAALDRSRTGRMGDIVATIQREQDEIIRAPLPGALVVQGGPGTGKTAVALHRAAYLLYTHRFPLERAGVLLVGPNRIFLRYIEQVLPALGEHSVTLATPATLVPTPVTGAESAAGARLKGDVRMAGVIVRAIADRGRPLTREMSVLMSGRRLTLSARASQGIIAQAKRRPGTHNSRRPFVERLVARHLHRQYEEAAPPDGGDDGEEREDDWPRFEAAARRERPVFEALERMWPVLTPEQLLHDLFGSPALIRSAAGAALSADEQSLLHRPRSARVDGVAWTDSDMALLDEASTHLGPAPRAAHRRRGDDGRSGERLRVLADLPDLDPHMRREVLRHLEEGESGAPDDEAPDPRTRTYGHILADEAQDLSPMELRMLGRRCPSGSMTIVGDLGQASGPWAPRSWEEVLAHLPVRRPPTRAELSVNYRTPSEVMDVAALVLTAATPELTPPTSVRRAGVEPLFTEVEREGLPEAVSRVAADELAALGEGKVAVICPAAMADGLRAALPDVADGSGVLDAAVALLTVRQAKGLEFDSVIVVEPSAIVAEGAGAAGRRALYVAMTRTTRRLHLVHADPLPPELRQDGRQAGARLAG